MREESGGLSVISATNRSVYKPGPLLSSRTNDAAVNQCLPDWVSS